MLTQMSTFFVGRMILNLQVRILGASYLFCGHDIIFFFHVMSGAPYKSDRKLNEKYIKKMLIMSPGPDSFARYTLKIYNTVIFLYACIYLCCAPYYATLTISNDLSILN